MPVALLALFVQVRVTLLPRGGGGWATRFEGTAGASEAGSNSPKIETLLPVPAYTWPLVIVGTVNLVAGPNGSRSQADCALPTASRSLRYSSFDRLRAS